MYLVINLAGTGNAFFCLTENGKWKVELASNADCATERDTVTDEPTFAASNCGECVDIPITVINSHRVTSNTRTTIKTVSAILPASSYSDLNKTTVVSINSSLYFVPEHASILQGVVLVI